ncbi:30S ribosomal protein S10 [Candidatus Micrarchaeota archaeon CG11_big_fil_rev_8_21_14_0_20_47_5]|nr:MAG: 30S ribosomal protein S10 [Candidatus Micrarchaeota archaeon CG1_02_47_40]PIN84241.1 MAG: 30S ribosomal protein S10 [Candidatus Micrarchaeota archaeon CG11_big_fil_rev_8_21_14_0_20_47_5]
MGRARIKLIGKDSKELDEVCSQIIAIARTTGVEVKGPVPLPRKRLMISTRRTPCGDGSDTYEHWEMRIHKRLIDVAGDERTLRQIMRVKVPDTVQVKITLE